MKRLGDCCGNSDNNFDLLRLMGAALVIFGHSYALMGPEIRKDVLEQYLHVTSTHHLGVQIFFVISGFLVTRSFVNTPKLLRFLFARALRIFPALCVLLICSVLLGAVLSDLSLDDYIYHPMVWEYFSRNVLLDSRWTLPGVFQHGTFPGVVNGSIWTLPVEFKLYFILSVLGILGVLRGRPWLANICGAALITVHLNQAGTYALTGGDQSVDDLLLCFLLGALLFINRRHIVISWRIGAMVLLATVLSVQHDLYPVATVQSCIAYWVLLLAYRHPLQWSWFGDFDLSYGLYLYAFPIQQTLAQLKVTDNLAVYILASFLFTLPFALASWLYIEKPALRLKRWSDRGKDLIGRNARITSVP